MRNQLLIFILLLSPIVGCCQQFQDKQVGAQLQLLVNIGSHRTTFGIRLQGYVEVNYAQLNVGTTYRWNEFNLGNRFSFGEWRHHLGLIAIAGPEKNPENFIWDALNHQTRRPYSLGYTYLWYLDKVGSAQRSGAWSLGLQRWDIQFENDVFGGQRKDRFRTGALQVSYRSETQRYVAGLQLWTGETAGSVWNHESKDRCPSGYRDLTCLPYGKLNHGVLYVGFQQLLAAGQSVGFQSGIDSEQIRHAVQNRFTHDLIILPKSVKRNTPHYPRLNEAGENVFTREETRRAKPYFQVNLNDVLLY